MMPSRPPRPSGAGIAHEDLGRRSVEPEEAQARPDHRAADHREFAGTRDVVDLQVVGEDRVADVRYEMKPKVPAAIITGTMASPSSPSVRFTGIAGADHDEGRDQRNRMPSGMIVP